MVCDNLHMYCIYSIFLKQVLFLNSIHRYGYTKEDRQVSVADPDPTFGLCTINVTTLVIMRRWYLGVLDFFMIFLWWWCGGGGLKLLIGLLKFRQVLDSSKRNVPYRYGSEIK